MVLPRDTDGGDYAWLRRVLMARQIKRENSA